MFKSSKFRDFIKRVITLLLRKPILVNASAISFNVIICIFPIIMILSSIFGFVLSDGSVYEESLRYVHSFLPDFIFEQLGQGDSLISIDSILSPFVKNRNINGIVGFVVLSFFSQSLFSSFHHSINNVFSSKENKPAWRLLVRNYLVFGIVGGSLLLTSICLQFISLIDGWNITIPVINKTFDVGPIWQVVNFSISFFITAALIYVLFRYLSDVRLKNKSCWEAGFIFSTLFEIAKFGLNLYFSYVFESYQNLYKSYAIILMLAFWIYYFGIMFNLTAIFTRAISDVYDGRIKK